MRTLSIIVGIAILVIIVGFIALHASPVTVAPLLPPSTGTTTGTESTASAAPAPAGATVSSASVAHTFTAHVGDTIAYDGASATLVSIAEDSRCPVDVNCIQAGTVRVNVKLQKGIFSTTQVLTLGVPVSAAGFTAELTSVEPDKHEGVTLAPSDYTFTFTVSGG